MPRPPPVARGDPEPGAAGAARPGAPLTGRRRHAQVGLQPPPPLGQAPPRATPPPAAVCGGRSLIKRASSAEGGGSGAPQRGSGTAALRGASLNWLVTMWGEPGRVSHKFVGGETVGVERASLVISFVCQNGDSVV